MIAKTKVLALSGSLRRTSYNRRALAVAARGAERAGAALTLVDLTDFPMPIYNPDEHEVMGFDPFALRLQGLMAGHDGFLFASPEYNGSLPAALKNAIDWCSRPSGVYERSSIFAGKAAAIISAGPGAFGGLRSLAHLRDVLTSVGVHVYPSEVAVAHADVVFPGDDGESTDAEVTARLESLGRGLVLTLDRLKGVRGCVGALA